MTPAKQKPLTHRPERTYSDGNDPPIVWAPIKGEFFGTVC